MPLVDVDAMNRSLDNDYGTTRGSNAAASHTLELWSGDPIEGGAEVVGSGYAAQTVMPSDWDPAENGAKSIAVDVDYPIAGEDWGTVTHWLLRGDDGTAWDAAALAEPLPVVEGASLHFSAGTITVYYDRLLEAP
jgi:hypothetical protein